MTTKALAVANVPEPTFNPTFGRQVRRAAITLKTSAAETSSYTTDTGIEVEALAMQLVLAVSASSSPTSLDVTVQGSDDATNWTTLGTFAQATGNQTKYLACLGARYVRYISTIVGTSFTYSIVGTYRF